VLFLAQFLIQAKWHEIDLTLCWPGLDCFGFWLGNFGSAWKFWLGNTHTRVAFGGTILLTKNVQFCVDSSISAKRDLIPSIFSRWETLARKVIFIAENNHFSARPADAKEMLEGRNWKMGLKMFYHKVAEF
jgi:hypothetical protein